MDIWNYITMENNPKRDDYITGNKFWVVQLMKIINQPNSPLLSSFYRILFGFTIFSLKRFEHLLNGRNLGYLWCIWTGECESVVNGNLQCSFFRK
jgi:hypothetical protein